MNTLSPSAPCPAWTYIRPPYGDRAILTMPHSAVSGINRNGRIVPCEPSVCRWCGLPMTAEDPKC